MAVYTNFTEVQDNLLGDDLSDRLVALYCFVDDFLQAFQRLLLPYVTRPDRRHPPVRKFAI